jgi:hypothetical protein
MNDDPNQETGGNDIDRDRMVLERLNVRELLAEAMKRLRDYCGNRTWLHNPLVTQGSSDRADFDQSANVLTKLEEILGGKLVGDSSDEELCSRVGENAVRGYFAAELREHEMIIEALRDARWGKLRMIGFFTEEEYEELMKSFPDHNPCF